MLDSRTSVPARQTQLPGPCARGASPPDGLTARQSQQDGSSFDSVLNSTLSDRKPACRSRPAVSEAEPSPRAHPRTASGRRSTTRQRRDQIDDPAALDAARAGSADRSDRDPATAGASDSDAAAPAKDPAAPPSDQDPADTAQQPAGAAAPAGDAAQQAAAVMAGSPDARALAAVSAAAGAAAAATDAQAVDPRQADPVMNRPGAGAGLAPLEWLARQQAARVSARTIDRLSTTPAAPPGPDGVPSPGQEATQGLAAAGKSAGRRSAQWQQVANLMGPSMPAGDRSAAQKAEQDTPAAPQIPDPATLANPDSLAGGHSLTADPTGLLDPASVSAAAASAAHIAQPASHMPAGTPASGLLDGPLLAPPDDNAARNMQRLAATVYATLGQGHSTARMQLQPPELGAVTAFLQLRQNKMDLRLEVASQEARDLVAGGLERLRDSLQQQGIALDRATVSVAPRNEHPAGDQQQSTWSGQQDQASRQFHSGQGGRHDERAAAVSFAVDAPVEASRDPADAAVAAVIHAHGLNVLA